MKSTILAIFAVFVLMFAVGLVAAEDIELNIAEGETYTISDNDSSVNLSIAFIELGSVKFVVGGENTIELEENDTFEVLGTNATVEDILFTEKETITSKVQILLNENLSAELIVLEDDDENETDCEDDEVWNETLEECVEIEDEDENETEVEEDKNETEREGLGKHIRGRVRKGVYTDEDGRQVRVSELAKMREKWFAGNYTAFKTYMELNETENGTLMAKLRNGKMRMIKIMPEKARERALERLKLKNCREDSNCTIELKEMGERNESLRYEIQAERHYRILGMFKAKAKEKVEIDAETGEIVSQSRAWWRFLASLDEDDETPEPSENDTNETA